MFSTARQALLGARRFRAPWEAFFLGQLARHRDPAFPPGIIITGRLELLSLISLLAVLSFVTIGLQAKGQCRFATGSSSFNPLLAALLTVEEVLRTGPMAGELWLEIRKAMQAVRNARAKVKK